VYEQFDYQKIQLVNWPILEDLAIFVPSILQDFTVREFHNKQLSLSVNLLISNIVSQQNVML